VDGGELDGRPNVTIDMVFLSLILLAFSAIIAEFSYVCMLGDARLLFGKAASISAGAAKLTKLLVFLVLL
jgi:hypothetical protein